MGHANVVCWVELLKDASWPEQVMLHATSVDASQLAHTSQQNSPHASDEFVAGGGGGLLRSGGYKALRTGGARSGLDHEVMR